MTILPNVEISYKNTLGVEIKLDRFGPFYLTSYEGFGSPENVRLSYATSLENLEVAVARLKDWMNE